MLNHWVNQNKPSMERLYLDASAFHHMKELDSREVKIWIEPSETLMAGWVIKAKGDVSALGKGLAFQRAVMDILGIDQSKSWTQLKSMAESNTPKPARGRQAKRFGERKVGADVAKADRAEESLNLDITSIKMLGPVTIQLDHREPESLRALLSMHPMITVEECSLDLGDILVEDRDGNRLIIERKRCDQSVQKTDFESSIQVDGRLFDQSERLKMEVGASDTQVIPIILLEGDVYGHSTSMLCQQIDGALSFLSAIQRVSVLPVYNQNHAAYVIAKLASHFVDGLYTPVSLHKAKPKAIFEQQRYLLEAMPGVSCKVAETLLDHFGSVRKVMAASREDFKAVKGLGPKKIDALMAVLGES